MATLVTFHAHPDDEATSTGGTIARLSDAGHRVVLVTATGGELGDVPDGLLRPGESVAERRSAELAASAAVLGVARCVPLGYRDSGMDGDAANDDPRCFWQADVDEAAERLAAILREEQADALTIYDEHGNYGHPDHVQVHRVGLRAAALAGTRTVYEATIDRDHLLSMADSGVFPELPDAPPVEFLETLGVPASAITTRVDVRAQLDRKRAAFAAHASQVVDTAFFLSLPPEAFELLFGEEVFVRHGDAPGLLDELA